MVITIPEYWLGEARYPVIVDPVFGCSTVGAQYFFYYVESESYEDFMNDARGEGYSDTEIENILDDNYIMPTAYNGIQFNRYKTNVPVQGLYKAHFYVAEAGYGNYCILAPVIFNEARDIPNIRVSGEEYGYRRTGNTDPLGWNNVSIKLPDIIEADSNIWLGIITSGIGIKFDYGGDYFDIIDSFNAVNAQTNIDNGLDLGNLLTGCGRYIPEYLEKGPGGDLRYSVYYEETNVHPKRPGSYDFKFSYYIQSVSAAFVRTLTAGVNLTDSGKRAYTAVRKNEETAGAAGTVSLSRRITAFLQAVSGLTDIAGHKGQWERNIRDGAYPAADTHKSVEYARVLRDAGNVLEDVKRMLTVCIKLFSGASIRDYIIGRFLKSREEIPIKSKVSREIYIDSKIH
jgi:hypothetical protein